MEKLFYEIRPYLFLGLASGALVSGQTSGLLVASSILLALCSLWVLTLRRRHRNF